MSSGTLLRMEAPIPEAGQHPGHAPGPSPGLVSPQHSNWVPLIFLEPATDCPPPPPPEVRPLRETGCSLVG